MRTFRFILLIALGIGITNLSAQNITRPNVVGPGGVKVNSYTGNMFYQRTDLFMAGRMPFDISFSYNSADQGRDRGYGRGWTFNYGMQAQELNGKVVITRNDGRKDLFQPGSGAGFTAPPGIFDSLTRTGSGYSLRTKEGTKYFFNEPVRRLLTRIEDRNGNGLNFSYSDSLITGIADDAGRSIQLNATRGHITSIVEANGAPTRTLKYEYDNAGNLVKVTDPLGNSFQYGYVVNGPMNKVTDRNANVVDVVYNANFAVKEIISCLTHQTINYNSLANTVFVTELVNGQNQQTSYKFDKNGNLIQKSGNCCGFNVQYEYDKDRNVSKVIDANNKIYMYTYDAYGNMLSETDPLGHTLSCTYEYTYNQLIKRIDKNGNSVVYDYDDKGNLIKINRPLSTTEIYSYAINGDVSSLTDPRGNKTGFEYDNYGNLAKINRPLGIALSYGYDSKSRRLTATDPLNHITTYNYDVLNRLIKVINALSFVSAFNYDNNGNIISLTDGNNHTTTCGYDALDRIIIMKNALGKSKATSYDAANNIRTITNEVGNTIRYNYDNLNRLIATTNAAGETVSYLHDNNGNIISILEPNGNNIILNYDGLNRLTSTKDAISTFAAYAYDNVGNAVSILDANGNITSYSYDALNRKISTTDALGHSSVSEYDASSNLVGVRDRNGHNTILEYDQIGRLIKKTDPLGSVTMFGYDLAGNNISVKDANSHITSYEYDVLNRKVSEIFANSTSKSYSYDGEDNIISRVDPNGVTINYSYDAVNRLLLKDYPGNNDDRYTYDDAGRMLTANNADAQISKLYDAANRLTSETLNGRKTSFFYNVSDKTRTINYPGGRTIKETYNMRNSLLQVSENGALIASFEYDAANRNSRVNYAVPGISTAITYDALDRKIAMLSSPGSLLNYNLSYDNEGNKLLEKKMHDPSRSEQFVYDAYDRLTQFKKGIVFGASITTPSTQTQYALDNLGNRISINKDGAVANYSVNSINAYANITGSSDMTNFYDNNGNLTNNGSKTFSYNNNDLLVAVNNGIAAEYKYDALGRRIKKSIGSAVTNYYYDNRNIIEERGNDSIIKATYVNDDNIDHVLTMRRGDSDYFYFYNNLGSVVMLANNAGKLVERYDYDPYGDFIIYNSQSQPISSSITGNPFYFTGREFDGEAESYYYRRRQYYAQTGKFFQKDPVGFINGCNWYSYTENNPANRVDPLGLAWTDNSTAGSESNTGSSPGSCRNTCGNTGNEQYGPPAPEPWDLNHDGKLQKKEADNWWLNGNGVEICVDNSLIDWSGLTVSKDLPSGKNFAISTTGAFAYLPWETASTYGGTSFTKIGPSDIIVLDQLYHYEMRKKITIENELRNTATLIGKPSGQGQNFNIHYCDPIIKVK